MENRLLKQGNGWRLGFNSASETYQGLVGGEDWAIELTTAEWQDFYRLVTQLSDTMQAMTAELMDGEKIACEAESDLIWVEVAGYPHAYELRLILSQGRRCEGNWPPDVVPELIRALQTWTVF
ncbi:MAG: DUF1818 family protein [Snowella sp.]|nr:DUF1818 family protein [Snowella sp.]